MAWPKLKWGTLHMNCSLTPTYLRLTDWLKILLDGMGRNGGSFICMTRSTYFNPRAKLICIFPTTVNVTPTPTPTATAVVNECGSAEIKNVGARKVFLSFPQFSWLPAAACAANYAILFPLQKYKKKKKRKAFSPGNSRECCGGHSPGLMEIWLGEDTTISFLGSATYEPVAWKVSLLTLPRPQRAACGSAFLCCILYGHGSRCSYLIVSLGHSRSLSRILTLLLLSRSFNFLRWLQSKLARTQLH